MALVFSLKAWTFCFHIWDSYLCCRLSHLLVGSMLVWTELPIYCVVGEGIQEHIVLPRSHVMLLG